MSLPKYGDTVYVERKGGLYEHYGTYVGNGKIVHVVKTGPAKGTTLETPFETFLDGSNEYKVRLFDKSGNETKILIKKYRD